MDKPFITLVCKLNNNTIKNSNYSEMPRQSIGTGTLNSKYGLQM